MTQENEGQPRAWYFGFEEYEKIGEPHKKEKSFAWTTAIGLQAVDGLEPSKHLLETARRNIEGEISIAEANKIIDDYYKTENGRVQDEAGRTEEADKVSARIVEILNDGAFAFRPTTLQSIHERLFKGIYKFAGKIRRYNITKKEWALDGDSVYYAQFSEIEKALEYDFEKEKDFKYSGLSQDDFIKHFASFISGVWQVHAFSEGNTRTTAVFAIKYLRMLGYGVNNEPFVNNSWYFRNALVRANYTSAKKGVESTTEFLELFFRNLLLGEKNKLKNRYTHIYWKMNEKNVGEDVGEDVGEKSRQVLALIKSDSRISAAKIAEKVHLSSRQVERIMAELKRKGILTRVGADRGGHWELTTCE